MDNWGGGYIVIGVEEIDGQPVCPLKGVPADKIDAYQKSILSKCKLLRPAYMPIVEVIDYESKKFIVLWCPGGDNRPYSSPKTMSKDNKERIHYIRKASSTVEPSDDEEKDLFNLANRIPFDDRMNHQAEISDLNITLIQNYLKETKSSLYEKSKTGDFLEVCSDMNIISNLPEYVKPKNVGLMFFSMEPDKFFPYTQIDVVQFPDGLGGNNIIEQTFKGPIHQQLRDALQYIRNTIITERIVKYPDRAESDSFPGPDRSVTIEGLRNYRVSNRRYRNRRIGDFLKELHLTEGRNTGFKKILNALEANGSPKPEFETDEARSYFISRLFIHEGFLEKKNGDESVSTPNSTPSSPNSTPSNLLTGELKGLDLRKQILILLRENPSITKKKMAGILGVSMYALKKELAAMSEEHIAEFVGFSRNGKWVVY